MFNIKKIAALLVVVTLFSFAIAGALILREDIGWRDFTEFDEKNSVSVDAEKHAGLDNIKEIYIDTVSADVTFFLVDSNDIKAHMYGKVSEKRKNVLPELIVKKGIDRLNIEIDIKKKNISSLDYINLNLDIYIPEDYAKEIGVKTSSGDISIGDLNLTSIDSESVSGQLIIENLTAQNINLKSTSGKIEVNNCKGAADINTISGKIEINNLASDVNLSTTSGQIAVNNHVSDLDIETVSGEISVEYENFDNNINMKTVSGDVQMRLPEDPQFYLNFKTTSGDIHCEFPLMLQEAINNKSIEGTVGSDKNNITIKTTSANVEILEVIVQ